MICDCCLMGYAISMFIERTFWSCDKLRDDPEEPYVDIRENDTRPANWPEATLVGSKLIYSELHAPAIDIDHSCSLTGEDLRLDLTVSAIPTPRLIDAVLTERYSRGMRLVQTSGLATGVSIEEQTDGTQRVDIALSAAALLLPSRTEGHFHLYTEHELTWKSYLNSLRGLVLLGIVQQGFVSGAETRGMSHLRKPAFLGHLSLKEAEAVINTDYML